MSNPYPSRRELRLQREREERAQLRDAEAQRWAEEVEDRQQRAAGAERQAHETLAKVEPVPASEATEAPLEPAQLDQRPDDNFGRRAAATPIDAPPDVDAPVEEAVAPRRRRRADSQITSTGMLPLITKRRDESAHDPKPRSRREARAYAQRASTERQDDIEALKAQQEAQQQAAPARPGRRATAPQAPPPPLPAVGEEPAALEEQQDEEATSEASEDTVVLSTWERYGESAVEITDMSGLDTLEIRRAELRDETERLTQEIIQLGQENPNVIDPLLLRRQKELAEKSQELQELETSGIEIVDGEDSQDNEVQHAPEVPSAPETPVDDGVPEEESNSDDTADEAETQPSRRARRASSGPMITGPFEVSSNDESEESKTEDTKPDFAAHFEQQPDTAALPVTGPEQPLEASSAHGLDTLDPKESEAPERLILTISIAVFAVGIIALIIALILLTR
ncbi:MAG: hypothetical protein L0I91_10540 [Yaniella sp.]|nr:hypothetical protein [Yaniella sp.]